MKNDSHTVPQGYFSDLKARLQCIPDIPQVPTAWQKTRPHLAMAAAFLAIVTAGTAVLRSSLDRSNISDGSSQLELAQLVRTASPYFVDEESSLYTETETTEEDLIDYLISTGVTIENIEADENEN